MPIKWQPFKDLNKRPHLPDIFEEDDRMPFSPHFQQEEPAIDIYQDRNNLYIELPLIGIKAKDVSVSIKNNILIIEGKIQEKKEAKEKDYIRKEIRKGSFHRAIRLPVEVKGNQASAETSEGMLKITLPKAVKGAPKANRVPIRIK